MSRFMMEITGQLGSFWQQSAEKEAREAAAHAAEAATVDENGAISWKSNGSYLMDDYCEKLEYAGYNFSREATRAARAAQVSKELADYRKNYRAPSEAEMNEMRRAFGEDVTVVDVLSGAIVMRGTQKG